jgi:putative Mn2+ efflux pump MntP
LFLARRLSGQLGSKVEMLAGLVLIALGIKMLSI